MQYLYCIEPGSLNRTPLVGTFRRKISANSLINLIIVVISWLSLLQVIDGKLDGGFFDVLHEI